MCSVAQLCLTLCDPIDWSPPGSSVHGIFHARILEWVANSPCSLLRKLMMCLGVDALLCHLSFNCSLDIILNLLVPTFPSLLLARDLTFSVSSPGLLQGLAQNKYGGQSWWHSKEWQWLKCCLPRWFCIRSGHMCSELEESLKVRLSNKTAALGASLILFFRK